MYPLMCATMAAGCALLSQYARRRRSGSSTTRIIFSSPRLPCRLWEYWFSPPCLRADGRVAGFVHADCSALSAVECVDGAHAHCVVVADRSAPLERIGLSLRLTRLPSHARVNRKQTFRAAVTKARVPLADTCPAAKRVSRMVSTTLVARRKAARFLTLALTLAVAGVGPCSLVARAGTGPARTTRLQPRDAASSQTT